MSNRPRLAMRTLKSSAIAVLSIILPAPFDHTVLRRDGPRLPLSSGVARRYATFIGGLSLKDRVGSGRPDEGAYSQDPLFYPCYQVLNFGLVCLPLRRSRTTSSSTPWWPLGPSGSRVDAHPAVLSTRRSGSAIRAITRGSSCWSANAAPRSGPAFSTFATVSSAVSTEP